MELEAMERQEGNNSFLKAVFHGLNAVIGVAILSISYALASGGWLSLIFLLIIATAACYSGLLAKRCMKMDPSIVSYADIGERAFGKIGRTIVSFILYVDLYLALTGYLILEGDNLHSLFPNLEVDTFGIAIGGKRSFVIVVALCLLPTVWLDDMRLVAYVSATGVVAAFMILIAVLWVAMFDGVGFHSGGELINWKGVPTAVSLYMFAYGGSPVFPTIYNVMQNNHRFSKVLLISFTSATICYTSMAIVGYKMYGSTLNSQITLNLPKQNISSKIAIYIAWIAPLSKYALIIEPIASTTESWFPTHYNGKRRFKIFVRTIIVVTQVIMALSMPFFESLISLAGALFCTTASITIPCLCYLKMSNINRKCIEGVVILVFILLGILLSVGGTYTSLLSIVNNINSRDK